VESPNVKEFLKQPEIHILDEWVQVANTKILVSLSSYKVLFRLNGNEEGIDYNATSAQ
jgi:hypothetical protein